VITQVKKNYITGISFALGWGGQLFHQTYAVGLGFVEKKFKEFWPGRQELWSLGSASTAV
jgi:hypothetical protein